MAPGGTIGRGTAAHVYIIYPLCQIILDTNEQLYITPFSHPRHGHQWQDTEMEIKRDDYRNKLNRRQGSSLIKIATGIRKFLRLIRAAAGIICSRLMK